MTHLVSSSRPRRPCGFTVRTVYCCDICGLEFGDQERIIQHLAEHHKDAESDSHDCLDPISQQQQQHDVTSSSVVLSQKSRRKSKRVVQPNNRVVSEPVDSKPLVCPECGRVYKYMRCFERHMQQVHRSSTQLTVNELQCKAGVTASHIASDTHSSADCEPRQDDLLNDSEQLELQEVTGVLDEVLTSVPQEQVDTGTSQRPSYFCAECPKQFQTLSSLQLHTIDKHTGWTFVCNWCGRLFAECHELHSHTIDDHSQFLDDDNTNSSEPVLNSHGCTICDFRYRSEEELTKHMTSHDDSLPGFSCSMCSGRFLTKVGLRCHVRRVHSGDYPCLCELCGDRFATAEERSFHVKQHAPDLCTLCGVRLRRRTYNGMDVGVTTCNVCYLEALGSRDGVQITGESATMNDVAKTQTSCLPQKYSCDLCGVKFAWRSNLRRHKRKHAALGNHPGMVHTEVEHFQCSYCSRVFNRASGLHKHILRHVEPKVKQPSFSCELCGQQFLWKKSLIRHLRTVHTLSLGHHIPVVTSASSVVQCDSTLSSSSSAEADAVNVDTSEEYNHDGDRLGKYDRHDVRHDAMNTLSKDTVPGKDGKAMMPCPQCGAAFFWRSNYLRHTREQHQGNKTFSRGRTDNYLQCNRCGRRFSRLSYLRVHLQAHENVEKGGGARSEQCLCSQCGHKLSSARMLHVHMLRHDGIRPHRCQLCDKSFFVAAELNSHVSVVHHGNRFVCDKCGHEANSKSALKLHCRSAHPVPGVEPSFPCSICSRRYWSQAALRRHADAHDMSRVSIRKAMCSICSMLFRHVYNLTHHISTTHADVDCATPFACATCHQQFDSGLAFKKHYRSKHRNR